MMASKLRLGRSQIVKVSAAFVWALFVLGQVNAEVEKESLPHIVIILANDLGYRDLGCYGAPYTAPTPAPALDQMATEGSHPLDAGFDRYYGLPHDFSKENGKRNGSLCRDREIEMANVSMTAMTKRYNEEVVRSIENQPKDAPFFIYMAHSIALKSSLTAEKENTFNRVLKLIARRSYPILNVTTSTGSKNN